MRSTQVRSLCWLLAHLLLASAPSNCQEAAIPVAPLALIPVRSPGDDGPARASDAPNATAEPGLLVTVGSARTFLDAVANPTVSHIVVSAHLDLSGAPPVDTSSLAIARVQPTLKSIKGECATLPPSVAAGLPPEASIPDGACVIRVLHAWLEVVVAAAAREAGDHALWVSGFVVQAARPAADQQEAPLLTVVGTNAWLANMLFIGDGFYGRGVRVSSGEVYVGDTEFFGFRSHEGSGVSFGGGGLLTLARCRFAGNAADSPFGAALLADGGDVLLANCSFLGNGENEIAVRGGNVWTSDTRGINVYNARTRQVAAATQFDADAAVVAPEGVAFDEFYDYFADALPPAEAGVRDAAPTPGLPQLVPHFPADDDITVAGIRQEQEDAVAAQAPAPAPVDLSYSANPTTLDQATAPPFRNPACLIALSLAITLLYAGAA